MASKKKNAKKSSGAKSDQNGTADKPAKNIIFVGRHRDGREKEAPKLLVTPEQVFRLPDDATQKGGFYHERAKDLIRAFPADFKHFVKKGE